MVRKKGILRILEASIAVLIIFAVIISFVVIRRPSAERDLSERINPLLEEIAKNNALRDQIVSGSPEANSNILALLEARIDEPDINYSARICDMEEVCGLEEYPDISGNLYAGSRVISSTINSADSKRVSIFLWFKS